MDNEKRLVELERRRRRAGRLLESGVKHAEVARRVGVTRTSVTRWQKLLGEGPHEADLKRFAQRNSRDVGPQFHSFGDTLSLCAMATEFSR